MTPNRASHLQEASCLALCLWPLHSHWCYDALSIVFGRQHKQGDNEESPVWYYCSLWHHTCYIFILLYFLDWKHFLKRNKETMIMIDLSNNILNQPVKLQIIGLITDHHSTSKVMPCNRVLSGYQYFSIQIQQTLKLIIIWLLSHIESMTSHVILQLSIWLNKTPSTLHKCDHHLHS